MISGVPSRGYRASVDSTVFLQTFSSDPFKNLSNIAPFLLSSPVFVQKLIPSV